MRIRAVLVGSVLVGSVLVGSVLVLATGLPASVEAGAGWVPPVEVAVVDAFRPPETRFGPGNRGFEYATTGGERVVAVALGRVGFVGSVGRSTFVVVEHEGGLRSTYAHLSSVLVIRGQRVEQGQILGLASTGFHLTARLGDRYVDPAPLLAGARPIPRLVAGPSPGLRGRAPVAGVVRHGLDPLRAVASAADDLTLAAQLQTLGEAAAAWDHQDCTPAGTEVAPPGGGRTLIQVGGLGSRSGDASIGSLDAGRLGYAPGHVVGFSYRGGCTPEPFGSEAVPPSDHPPTGNADVRSSARIPVSGYGPIDTHQPIDVSAAHLVDLIEEVALADPARPIDVAAHSLGGVIARRAVEILDERGRLGGPPAGLSLGVVMTIGSPHRGADLATLGMAIEHSGLASVVDAVVDHRRADAVRQISEAGLASLAPPTPPPPEVTVVAVAGAVDPVVPGDRAVWSGARNVVVPPGLSAPGAIHSELPGRPEVARGLSLAVAGLAPACIELATLLTSTLSSRATSSTEDLATVVLGVGRYLL